MRPEEIEKGLREIYDNPETSVSDLAIFEKAPGRRRWIVSGLILFLSLLAVIGWAGFFIFRPAEKFAGENIDFTISAPADLTAGAENEFVIHYRNRESVPLGAVEISTAYPKEFAVTSMDPEVPEPGSWKIGSLPKGGEGEIKLKGKVLAPKGKSITIQAYLTYRPANFNSEFQKVASATFPITNSVIDVVVEGPEQALPGEEIQYLVRYRNGSDIEVEGAEIRAFYAENFFPKKASPAPSTGEGLWRLPRLAPGEGGEIKVTGSFSSAAEGVRETGFEAGTPSLDGRWTPMLRAASAVALVKSELKLLLIANGAPKSGVVNFGDTLRYSLTFQNRSQVTLSDVSIVMRLDGTPVSSGKSVLLWDTLQDEAAGKLNIPTITWTKRELPALERLEPGDEGTIDFSIELASVPFSNKGFDYKVAAYAEAVVGKIGAVRSSRHVRSETIETRLLSDLTFIAEGRYFNDEDIALGTGPVPPKVGETTAYRIWWTIKNSLHEIEGINVTTTLPDGVIFTGKFDGGPDGTITYDENSRKVTWAINKLPASSHEFKADFEVSITPAEDQLGAPVVLTGFSNLEGQDKALETLIFRTATQITTNLETDPNLSGRGEVRR